jgi:hypothetical protein
MRIREQIIPDCRLLRLDKVLCMMRADGEGGEFV